MTRRFHTPEVRVGSVQLDANQARHARDVLRLEVGEAIELFDDAGHRGAGAISEISSAGVAVHVAHVEQPPASVMRVTVASAVPKANRADWMVEKLSEVGCYRFIPLATERSVVLPEGKNKIERWRRLASESAKQCSRVGVMQVETLMDLRDLLKDQALRPIWYLSLERDARPIAQKMKSNPAAVTLLVGPEGDWTATEISSMREAGCVGVRLTSTVLRTETAAILGAGVVMTLANSPSQ